MSGPLDWHARSSGGFGGAAAGVHRNNAELAKNAKDNRLGNALCVSLSATLFESKSESSGVVSDDVPPETGQS